LALGADTREPYSPAEGQSLLFPNEIVIRDLSRAALYLLRLGGIMLLGEQLRYRSRADIERRASPDRLSASIPSLGRRTIKLRLVSHYDRGGRGGCGSNPF
jgi:hypothetical protein